MHTSQNEKKERLGPLLSINDEPPIVSVLIPTYNRALFICEAIASVLTQTFSDFEIIIVDDGSTDNTEMLIREFSDSRIIYIKQKNKGRSHARNVALSCARGRYIAFLDSDDVYLSGKLALQVSYLDSHPHVGMLYTSADCIDSAGNKALGKYTATVSGRIYKSIAFFRPITITLPTVMVRRELFDEVGSFDENLHRFEDTDMWRRISKMTCIDALSEVTCKLRTHSDNSLCAQNPNQIIRSLNYYAQKVLREDSDMGHWMLRRGLAGLYFYYSRAFLTVPGWQNQGISLLYAAYRFWLLSSEVTLLEMENLHFSRLSKRLLTYLIVLYSRFKKIKLALVKKLEIINTWIDGDKHDF